MKTMFPKLALMLFLCLCSWEGVLAGEPHRYKPKWITHQLPDSKSGTYIFVSAYGEGSSLDMAKQNALVDLSFRLETERGIIVNSMIRSKTKEQYSSVLQDNYYFESNEFEMEVEEKGRELSFVSRVIDEYWEHESSGYKIYVLYAIADKSNHGRSYDDEITVTAKYGAAGLLSVIPGVGQFYKGTNAKGIAVVAGEVAAISGILLCENTRASYKKKMFEQPKYASIYNSRMDTWETARNLCIGAAGVVYVVNLIDALATKGANRVVVKKKKIDLSLRPYASIYGNGVGLALNF